MRSITSVVLSAVLAIGGTAVLVSPAEAAPARVKITTIAKKSIGWDGKAKFKPSAKVTKAGKKAKIKIKSKTITVRQGSKVVAKNRKSVTLRPGTYQMSVKVTYLERGKKIAAWKKFRTVVSQSACATNADYRSLIADPNFVPEVTGDSVSVVAKKLRSKGKGETYTPQELIDQLKAFKLIFGEFDPSIIPEIDAAIAEIEDLIEKGVTEFEDRTYRGCGDKFEVSTLFANGELMDYTADKKDDFFSGLATPARLLTTLN